MTRTVLVVAGEASGNALGAGLIRAARRIDPEVRFLGIPSGMKPGRPPSAGLQFFGKLHIDGRTRIMTVSLHDLSGRSIYSVPLSPER